MAQVQWTVTAQKHPATIREYVAIFSESRAAALVIQISNAVDMLESYPHLGRVIFDEDQSGLRELIVGNYRVVYRLTGGVPELLAVLHGRQDLPRWLEANL